MEDLDKLKEATLEIPSLAPGPIDLELISQRGRKIEKLINNASDAVTYDLRKQDYFIEFEEPIFVSEIRFISAQKAPALAIKVQGPLSREFSTIHDSKDNRRSICIMNSMMTSISFTKKTGLLDPANDQIQKIEILGFRMSEVDQVAESIARFASLKDEFAAKIQEIEKDLDERLEDVEQEENNIAKAKADAQQSIASATSTLEKKKSEIEDAEEEISNLGAQKESETKALTGLKSQVSSARTELKQATDTLESHKNRSEEYRLQIAKAEAKLRELTREIGLHPNEYGSFFKQGNRFIWLYIGLGSIPTAVIGYVGWELFHGAVKLLPLYTQKLEVPLTDILLSRIPFVTVAVFLIHAAYTVLKLLALKIVDIQEEKLNFSKIAILAQDIVDKSAQETPGITSEEKLKQSIALRFKTLQTFLEHELTYRQARKERDQGLLSSALSQLPNPLNMFEKKGKT